MQKQFLTFMHAQDIYVQTSWQLLGPTENIDVAKFAGKCVNFIWKYDNGWKVHVANNQNYSYTGDTFTSLSKGEGFWIKGSSNCDIDTNNTNSNANQDIKALLVGKTFYIVFSKILHNITLQFDNNKVTITGDDDVDQLIDYSTSNNALIMGKLKFNFKSSNSDYNEFGYSSILGSFEYDTDDFESNYNASISTFTTVPQS